MKKKTLQYKLIDYFRKTSAYDLTNELMQTLHLSRQKVQARKIEKMKALFIHAYETTVYYKEVFDQCGFNPYSFSIETFEAFQKVPCLTKKIIRDRYNDLISSKANKYIPRVMRSSGTSGNPMKYILSKNSHSYLWADAYRQWLLGGWEFGDAIGVFRGSAITKLGEIKGQLYRLLNNWTFFDMFQGVSEQSMNQVIKTIEEKNLQFLYGYTAGIYKLASYLASIGKTLPLKAVFTTTEVLQPNWRKTIEETFSTSVFDFAQVCDGGFSMFQCSEKHYHISEDICHIEYDANKEMQEVIVTGYFNFTMPFIKYKNGDLYIPSNTNQCLCGCNFMRIDKLAGRSFEYFNLPNNEKVHGAYFSDTFREFDMVKSFQIIQINETEILFLIHKKKITVDYNAFQKGIHEIKTRFPKMNFKIQYVKVFIEGKNNKTVPYIPLDKYKEDKHNIDKYLNSVVTMKCS